MGKKNRETEAAPNDGEVRENVVEGVEREAAWQLDHDDSDKKKKKKKDKKKKNSDQDRKPYKYTDELVKLQFELIKLQDWVQNEGLKVVVIFEGRDAAGKGGVIKRITESLNPRVCRIVALGTPTERERGQWYFQRYVAQLPAKGEIVLFDRSWYNRAGVERVMGFCTKAEYKEFLRACPLFEEMLIRSGIILVKYWFSVSDEEQELRFEERIKNPIKRWKLSPMDLKSREHWVEYSRAKDTMQKFTDTELSPWNVVDANNKKKARLNCISHLLSMIPYKEVQPPKIKLAPRQKDDGYVRPPKSGQRWVPEIY
ncbi:polyphosphate kinase 2 [Reyranella sp. CPCC 100927]|uniref:polyphosphate kinase 2 n=1 Tax=Reyranella sp. CPCC 100927 TaxID=2599616 RepID=UPI0011B4739C|nr:polyphosphate kinase 2 [Reyranella sp. CPCC 100927]TWT05010.1 polyphosphate kinase 2 [Reyranella sp. CPCC 100927]